MGCRLRFPVLRVRGFRFCGFEVSDFAGEVSGFTGSEVSGTIFCCNRSLHVPFTEKLWSENAWLAGFGNKLEICNDPTANSCGIAAFFTAT